MHDLLKLIENYHRDLPKVDNLTVTDNSTYSKLQKWPKGNSSNSVKLTSNFLHLDLIPQTISWLKKAL